VCRCPWGKLPLKYPLRLRVSLRSSLAHPVSFPGGGDRRGSSPAAEAEAGVFGKCFFRSGGTIGVASRSWEGLPDWDRSRSWGRAPSERETCHFREARERAPSRPVCSFPLARAFGIHRMLAIKSSVLWRAIAERRRMRRRTNARDPGIRSSGCPGNRDPLHVHSPLRARRPRRGEARRGEARRAACLARPYLDFQPASDLSQPNRDKAGRAEGEDRRAASRREGDSKRIHLRCALLIGSRFLRASGPHIRHVCPRHSGLSVLPVPAAVTRKQGDALCGPVAGANRPSEFTRLFSRPAPSAVIPGSNRPVDLAAIVACCCCARASGRSDDEARISTLARGRELL